MTATSIMTSDPVAQTQCTKSTPSSKADLASAPAPPETHAANNNILDIRRDKKHHSLVSDIFNGLRPAGGGEKRLPTLLLYDEKGLKLFEKITYLDEYYLTNAEIQILEQHADAIARRLQPGSIVLELGSGLGITHGVHEYQTCDTNA